MIKIEDLINIPVDFVTGLYDEGILTWVILALIIIILWVVFK